jgi:hypothetical protein
MLRFERQRRREPLEADNTMRRVGSLGFSVTISTAGPNGKDSKVRVRSALDRFGLPGMELAASSAPGRAPHVDPSRLPVGLGWSIDDRLRHAGARKGRVLSVWQGQTLVAAWVWHLHETGPPVIFDLGARSDLPVEQQRRACAALLACLRDVAQTLGRTPDELRWSDRPLDRVSDPRQRNHYRAEIRARAAALQFVPLRPRPKFWRGRWAVKRSF